MANNRMVLLCNICVPEGSNWEYHQPGVQSIAKWYPAMGGYAPISNFDEFLIDHNHPEYASEHYKAGATQSNPVRLVYESEDKPIL